MPEKEIDFRRIFSSIKKQWKKVLIYGVCGVVVGTVVAFSIPRTYTSTVLVAWESSDSKGMPQSMGTLASLAGLNLDQSQTYGITTKLYPQIVGSTPFLMEFAAMQVTTSNHQTLPLKEYLLDHQKQAWWSAVFSLPGRLMGAFTEKKEPQAASVPDMRNLPLDYRDFVKILSSAIVIKSEEAKSVIDVSVTLQDPSVAQQVVDSTIVQLGKYINLYKTSKAREQLSQTIVLFQDARHKYDSIQNRLAETMDKNQNLITESAKLKITRIKEEGQIAYSVFSQLASQVEAARLKVSEQTSIATVIEPSSVPIYPTAPKKKIIVVALFLLGAFVKISLITIKELKQ